MFRIEIEKADGEVYFLKNGLEFNDVSDAIDRMEFLWNMQAHTGNYASFRVVDVAGDVYSELEC